MITYLLTFTYLCAFVTISHFNLNIELTTQTHLLPLLLDVVDNKLVSLLLNMICDVTSLAADLSETLKKLYNMV